MTGARDSEMVCKCARFEKTKRKPKREISSANSALNVNDRDFRVDMEERCMIASAFKATSGQFMISRFVQRHT